MRFGLTLGAVLLASNLAFAQVATDMATLERRVDDAQAAYDRNPSSADRQEMTETTRRAGLPASQSSAVVKSSRAPTGSGLSDHIDAT